MGTEKQVGKVQEAEVWAGKNTKLKAMMSWEELGKLPVIPSGADPSSCPLSDPAKPLCSWPWGTRHQPPALQPELWQRRGASLQP